MNELDFPAAHSMDTYWFAVDAQGHVATFDTGEDGAFPIIAGETREGWEIFDLLQQELRSTSASCDEYGRYSPQVINWQSTVPSSVPILLFLRSLEPIQDAINNQSAFV